MVKCVDSKFANEVSQIELEQGFFASLPEMPGGMMAVHQMAKLNLNVFICTSPLLNSRYCVQEKMVFIYDIV